MQTMVVHADLSVFVPSHIKFVHILYLENKVRILIFIFTIYLSIVSHAFAQSQIDFKAFKGIDTAYLVLLGPKNARLVTSTALVTADGGRIEITWWHLPSRKVVGFARGGEMYIRCVDTISTVTRTTPASGICYYAQQN